MNVFLVINDSREADLLKSELNKHAPGVHIDVSPNTQDALTRLEAPGACDVIVLDTSVPRTDAVNLVTAIRTKMKPIWIVAMTGANEKEFPGELYKAGVDRFITKRAGFVPFLVETLPQAKKHDRAEPAHDSRQLRMLYAGDIENAKRHLSSLPNVILEPIALATDGTLRLPNTGASFGDVIVVDSSITGAQTLKAIKELSLQEPDIPAIVLTNPGDEDTAIQAMKTGAADCIAKSGNYFHRLLPAAEREIGRRELAREKAALKSRENRLRQIVETMPVGVTVISSDGAFLAINRAGLKLMGATRLEQIIGKNLIHLVPQEEQDRVLTFLKTINGWTNASIRLDWKGLDGTIPGIELRAVPMRRDGIGTAAALAAISPAGGNVSGHSAEEEKNQEDLNKACREYEARIQELQGKYNLQQSKWEAAVRQAESRRLAAEEQQAKLKVTAEETAARLNLLLDEQKAERANWEQSRQGLKEQFAKIEAETKSLKSAQASLLETHSAEQAKWNEQCQDLEHKLVTAETNLAQQSEAFRSEHSQWDLARRQLEQRYEAAEEQQAALQDALHDAESRLSLLTEKHSTDFSQSALIQKELESKYQVAEKQRTDLQDALNEAESHIAQLSEKHRAELSQRDFAQKKAEQKCQAAEKQRIALQETLNEAESNLAQVDKKHSNERAQWDLARLELEQRCQNAEKQQAAAEQNAARETESRLAWISEQNQAKSIQLEKMQQELEQLRADSGRFSKESPDFHLRNQRLSQFTSAGVVLAKRDGRVLECNDSAARMFGYAGVEEALSQTGENQFRIYAFEGALDARLQREGKLENIEWSSLSRDGRLIRIQESAMLLESTTEDGPLVERILTDVTKIHKLNNEIRNMRRMESAGDLAIATVKGFKDLCASLAHSGELLVQTPNDSNAVQQIAGNLLNDATRGVKHARQFLSVALKTDRTPSLLNINEILVNNNLLLHSLIGEDIDLQTSFEPRIGLVSADRNDMVLLIGDLLANSREALPLGGTVTIETSNIEIDSPTSGHPVDLPSGIYVRIMFNADGCAVQPEKRTPSIRMIVERMGGYLETINDPKLGNVHKVYLPRVEAFVHQEASLLSNAASA